MRWKTAQRAFCRKTFYPLIALLWLNVLTIGTASAVPLLSVDTELYFDTISSELDTISDDTDGTIINDTSLTGGSSTFGSIADLGVGEVFTWTKSITNDLANEFDESLYAESFASFYLDAAATSSYLVTMAFSFLETSPLNAEALYVGSVIDGVDTDLSIPTSETYSFEIAPDETKEFLWYYEMVGAAQSVFDLSTSDLVITEGFYLDGTASLAITGIEGIVSAQVSEPSTLALLVMGLFGLGYIRKTKLVS